MKTQYKFIEFVPSTEWEDVWECRMVHDEKVIGIVTFYLPYKGYTIRYIDKMITFEAQSSHDIADFLDQLNRERKA